MDTDQIIDLADTVGDNYTAIYMASIIHTHITGQEPFEAKHIYPTYCEIANHNTQFEPRAKLMQAHADGESTTSRYANLTPRYFERKLIHLTEFRLLERADDTDDHETYRIGNPPAAPAPLIDALEAHTTLSFPNGILDSAPRVEHIRP